MKYPPPTVGKFRTVTKLTVRKFRTLLLVNQGRACCVGMVVAGLVLSGWLEAALAAGESFEAFEMRVINDAHEHLEQIDV